MDDDQLAIRRRAEQALADADVTLARLRERVQRGETEWPAPTPPAVAASRLRAPEGRAWALERAWVAGIVDAKLAELADAIGEVVASERTRHRAETEILQQRIAVLEVRLADMQRREIELWSRSTFSGTLDPGAPLGGGRDNTERRRSDALGPARSAPLRLIG